MEIQSLSVVVPAPCPNKCPFCVSRLNKENKKFSSKNIEWTEIYKRLLFARDNNCNTMVITSTGEALQNERYIQDIFLENFRMPKPFRWIELQTSGIGLRDFRFLNPIDTISLSVVDLFDSKNNAKIMGIPDKLYFDIDELAKYIKKDRKKNLRISLNLTDSVARTHPQYIFDRLKQIDADQITFRLLYHTNSTEQDEWIKNNTDKLNHIDNCLSYEDSDFLVGSTYKNVLKSFIKSKGRELEKLPFGATRYSVDGISVVIDDDCMDTKPATNTLRYLILRPNAKLYSKWDDKGSLIF